MGDDHTAESSTTAHQSEYHFIDVMIPILNPAGVQEVLDYGLYGWAMSRFTGSWVALKTMHETIESTADDRCKLRSGQYRHPDRFRHAARRPQHSPERSDPGAGSAAARLQARRDARVSARQQDQPHHYLGRTRAEDRHHYHRQKLSRRPAGVRRTRHRRSQMQSARHPALQGRVPVAAQPARACRVRRRSRPDHRRRGEALAHRSAGPRGIVRHRQPAGLHRQTRRSRATGCFRSRARSTPTT